MAMIGMDVEAIRNIGGRLQGQADAIDGVIGQIESLIGQPSAPGRATTPPSSRTGGTPSTSPP